MPTLNPEYNALLLYWVSQGASSNPECEECGCDLTGKDVIETDILWVCCECADEQGLYHADDELCAEYGEPVRHRDPGREDFHSDG